jgi:carbon-monoxide dehydrogenase large subunit
MDGTVLVRTGSVAAGQQHDMLYRKVVRSVLPVPAEDIRVIEGDTDACADSDGTMGSRTTQLAGTAVLRSTEEVVTRLSQLAADVLEAAETDNVFHEGAGFGLAGVPDSARTLSELVAASTEPVEARCVYEQPDATYPAAAHLSLVEVDTDTGRVTPLRHVAVTECGQVLDPPSAHAQVVGASVQGIAQALYEEATFDADGNPLTASFADYGIPSAADVPPIEAHFRHIPSPRNPLGAKGVGEIGMLAAPVAVQNAVIDAVRPFGVRHLDMPCTAEKVWRALAHPATLSTPARETTRTTTTVGDELGPLS